MKKILSLALLTLLMSCSSQQPRKTEMDWTGLSREKIDLALPLLIVKGSKGLLACGYISVGTCEKTNEACAIVSGVKTHDDMLEREIKAISPKAASLGVKVGMKGSEALNLMR